VPFEETEVRLPEGALLVMFTDGVVESREREMDTGLKAMRSALGEIGGRPGAPQPLEAMCDSLIGTLVPGPADDDAALLIARTAALPADRVVSRDLPAEPAIVAEARAWAARQLDAWGLEDLTFTTELLVSELVTNAIRHAQPPIQLRMILDTTLSCEVSDGTVTAPRHRRADRYDEGGRGLMLVARLAGRWGTRYAPAGKTIWAQQPLPDGTSATRLQAEDAGDPVGEAATPARMVVPAAELPVGHVAAGPHQRVAEGAGVGQQVALLGPHVEEQPAPGRAARVGRRHVGAADLPVLAGPPQRRGPGHDAAELAGMPRRHVQRGHRAQAVPRQHPVRRV
jgi:anti-sigma regulatory factor (Ser/Thr protein kinase)